MSDTTAAAMETISAVPAPAEYRKLIVEALAESDGGLPIRRVEKLVAQELPESALDSIEDEVQSLIDWELVARNGKKMLTLTEAGARFWKGIQALSQT